MVVWNRHGATDGFADTWERSGGSVLVCENGYIGADQNGHQLYAISVHGHNGSGWFHIGQEDRFARLGVELKPWRTGGEYVLVCGQRGVGSERMASPTNWHFATARAIRQEARLPVRVREHPGMQKPLRPLEVDLAGAAACVVWSSATGVRALAEGIPTHYYAPKWICSEAATQGFSSKQIKSDELRRNAMHRMSWAQWSIAEIENGEPFALMLENLSRATW